MRGKGSKLGKPCPKDRLSQDRLPIEPFSGLLRFGLLPFSGFGIFTFGIVSFGKSSWRHLSLMSGKMSFSLLLKLNFPTLSLFFVVNDRFIVVCCKIYIRMRSKKELLRFTIVEDSPGGMFYKTTS